MGPFPLFMLSRGLVGTSRVLSCTEALSVRLCSVNAPCAGAQPDFRINRSKKVDLLEEILGVDAREAFKIICSHKSIRHSSNKTLKANFQAYQSYGIQSRILNEHPELLGVLNIKRKLEQIRTLPYDFNSMALLILMRGKTLPKFVESELKLGSKIEILSRLLKVDPLQACNCFVNRPFLCSLSVDKIGGTIELLHSYGITSEDILTDLYVLRYSCETIKSRLDMARENKMVKAKTWMVRAQDNIYNRHLEKRCEVKSILGENTTIDEYLMNRLDIDPEAMTNLMRKQPALRTRSLRKVKDMLDFLFSAGITPYQILRMSKILVSCLETIQRRVKVLNEKNIKFNSLHVLTKSERQFSLFLLKKLKGY